MSDAPRWWSEEDRAARGVAAPTPGPRAERARSATLAALRGCDGAVAAWECGSASFGRADLRSDLDVGVVVRDGQAEAVLDAIGAALAGSFEGELDTWRRGRTAFGTQRFWQPVAGTDHPGLTMVDATAIEVHAEGGLWRWLIRPEHHGHAIVLHDPEGVLVEALDDPAPFDAAAHRARMQAELERIAVRRRMLGPMGVKELDRGRVIDARWLHDAMVVAPLVTLLGMCHRPLRYDFAMRYLHEELPERDVARLLPILEPHGERGLRAQLAAGLAWIDELLAVIDVAALPIEGHSAQMRGARPHA